MNPPFGMESLLNGEETMDGMNNLKLSPSQDTKIKKPAAKVSKACDNCRKRKIKCTGKMPCPTCEAYQCPCIYSAPKPRKKRTSKRHIRSGGSDYHDDITSIESNNNSVSQISNNDINNLNNINNNNNVISNSSNENSLRNMESNQTQNRNQCFPELGTIKAPFAAFDGNLPFKRGPSSPENSSKNDCKEVAPIIQGDNGFYQDDEVLQEELSILQTMVRQLEKLHKSDSHRNNTIANIKLQINDLIDSWTPDVDFTRLSDVPEDDILSLESHLMKNKYTEQVCITNFSIWSNGKRNADDNTPLNPTRQPLIDDFFGLYSAFQAFSLQGIGYSFQKFFVHDTSNPLISKHIKATLYILLRFFDMCFQHLNDGCVSIANPLENYLRRKNLMAPTPTPTPSGNSSVSVGSPNTANEKSLVVLLINRFPQPFIENLTKITIKQLMETVDKDFEMFKLVLDMFEAHRSGFESFMVNEAPKKVKDNGAYELTTELIETFHRFCESEELILALTYSYYNSTLYRQIENNDGLEYLEILVSLLGHQLWCEEFYGFQKVLSVALNQAVKMGLQRWEFYIGLDEQTALRRRKVWWKLYSFEKVFISKMGCQPTIDDSKMNCLLPKSFISAGFLTNADFICKINKVSKPDHFDSMPISDLAEYGTYAVLQVVSVFFSDVLYNERYTSIRNVAKPPSIKTHYLSEISNELISFKERMEGVRRHTSLLFDITNSVINTSPATNTPLSKEDKNHARNYVLCFEYHSGRVLAAVDNLISRLNLPRDLDVVQKASISLQEDIYASWTSITSVILKLEDSYSVCQAFKFYGATCICLLTSRHYYDSLIRLDDLFSIVRIFKECQGFGLGARRGNCTLLEDNRLVKSYRKSSALCAILCRIMLLRYMTKKRICISDLLKLFEEKAPDLAMFPEVILDTRSEIYQNLLEPVLASGFHLNINKMLENNPILDYGKCKQDSAQSISPNMNCGDNAFGKTVVQVPMVSNIPNGPLSGNSESYRSSVTSIRDYPSFPSLKSDGTYTPTYSPLAPYLKQGTPQLPEIEGQVKPQPQDQLPLSDHTNIPNIINLPEIPGGYNLGTLDEFVNNTDLSDLYNVLWSDLYSDAVL
ncbi:drug-responsive transcription factor PDR1 NDAI_0D03540 [Naumovozyma dairenensis CBS 421]|uniref:Zn(2)-C6 fungal-type domain-containing protein n=1 Tax=Naumovozyma dairenensis (strain ATCC 10597 / BCRC 20456 / CBS 421 / NBRC 0211 / NRRL Y-12639) TaxID=1071378 RepID=G0WA57_NAUDC|nr:hypothetical protein NDAI_0D03540 [Naumovozyma dairenensis CBS 421]CCD24668.1 hypothetical protein NDAI_0D03540 [Naumovozyma dairenensis CBS 421]